MKTLIALLAVVSVGVFFLYFRKNRFSKKKNDGTNQSYISFMQKLCDDEFVPTIGNAGYYELDNNLIVSSHLYTENEGLWNGKEVVQVKVMCASPIEEHSTFKLLYLSILSTMDDMDILVRQDYLDKIEKYLGEKKGSK